MRTECAAFDAHIGNMQGESGTIWTILPPLQPNHPKSDRLLVPQRYWLISPPGILLSMAVLSGGIAWWLIALPVLTLSNMEEQSTHFPHVFLHAVSSTVTPEKLPAFERTQCRADPPAGSATVSAKSRFHSTTTPVSRYSPVQLV